MGGQEEPVLMKCVFSDAVTTKPPTGVPRQLTQSIARDSAF